MKEELTVPARSTAATGNQVVTVGFSSVDRDRAHITVSLATGEQDDSFLYLAQSVAVRARDGTVYRVHLLTIDESSVRVRVVGYPPEPPPEPPPRPSDSAAVVRVKETLKSCRAALESIVAKHIPKHGEYLVVGFDATATQYRGRAAIREHDGVLIIASTIGSKTYVCQGRLVLNKLTVYGDFDVEYFVRSDGSLVGTWGNGGMETLTLIGPPPEAEPSTKGDIEDVPHHARQKSS